MRNQWSSIRRVLWRRVGGFPMSRSASYSQRPISGTCSSLTPSSSSVESSDVRTVPHIHELRPMCCKRIRTDIRLRTVSKLDRWTTPAIITVSDVGSTTLRSIRSICAHQLFNKLGVRTRAQLVKVVLEQYRDQL